MHKSEPTLIVMKRRIAGPEIIDPGMGFAAARKAMLHADGLDAGSPCAAVAGPDQEIPAGPDKSYDKKLTELRKLAGQLTDAVESLADSSPDRTGDSEVSEDEETHGEERELS